MDFSKTMGEVRKMAEQLPDNRFAVVVRLAWGCIAVAALFGLAALSAALPWGKILP